MAILYQSYIQQSNSSGSGEGVFFHLLLTYTSSYY